MGPHGRHSAICTAITTLAALAALSSCRTQPESGCEPGRSKACTCSNGSPGAQTCRSGGTWGSCECDGDAGGTDATPTTDSGSLVDGVDPDPHTDTGTESSDSSTADTGDAGADELPSVDSPNFEAELRERVGAEKGRDWESFCDPSDRTVHRVTDAPYGAQPGDDGDDSSALSNAIETAAGEDPSGVVVVPEGEYEIDQTVEIDTEYDGVCLVGEGRDTVLAGDDADTGTIFFDDDGWGTWDENRRTVGFTLANLRITEDGLNSDLVPGRDNLVANLWIEDVPGRGLKISVSGTTLRDITVRNIDGHGIGVDNGVLKMGRSEAFDNPTELKNQRDPNPIRLRRIHVDGAGRDDHSGRHSIDFGSGANISIDTFIAENSDGYGMKTPSVANARIYNGLVKNSYLREYYINLGYEHDVYIDNVKYDAAGGSPEETRQEIRLDAGHVHVGEIVVANAKRRGMKVVQEQTELAAESITVRGSGGEGLRVANDATARIETFSGSDNGDCDLRENGADLTVENLDVDESCGDIGRGSVDPPELPGME